MHFGLVVGLSDNPTNPGGKQVIVIRAVRNDIALSNGVMPRDVILAINGTPVGCDLDVLSREFETARKGYIEFLVSRSLDLSVVSGSFDVYTCNKCQNDILSGFRWNCPICPDFDLCHDCKHAIPWGSSLAHKHPLQCLSSHETHARHCKTANCKVLYCVDFKRRIKEHHQHELAVRKRSTGRKVHAKLLANGWTVGNTLFGGFELKVNYPNIFESKYFDHQTFKLPPKYYINSTRREITFKLPPNSNPTTDTVTPEAVEKARVFYITLVNEFQKNLQGLAGKSFNSPVEKQASSKAIDDASQAHIILKNKLAIKTRFPNVIFHGENNTACYTLGRWVPHREHDLQKEVWVDNGKQLRMGRLVDCIPMGNSYLIQFWDATFMSYQTEIIPLNQLFLPLSKVFEPNANRPKPYVYWKEDSNAPASNLSGETKMQSSLHSRIYDEDELIRLAGANEASMKKDIQRLWENDLGVDQIMVEQAYQKTMPNGPEEQNIAFFQSLHANHPTAGNDTSNVGGLVLNDIAVIDTTCGEGCWRCGGVICIKCGSANHGSSECDGKHEAALLMVAASNSTMVMCPNCVSRLLFRCCLRLFLSDRSTLTCIVIDLICLIDLN